jgi:hypothetical protein
MWRPRSLEHWAAPQLEEPRDSEPPAVRIHGSWPRENAGCFTRSARGGLIALHRRGCSWVRSSGSTSPIIAEGQATVRFVQEITKCQFPTGPEKELPERPLSQALRALGEVPITGAGRIDRPPAVPISESVNRRVSSPRAVAFPRRGATRAPSF